MKLPLSLIRSFIHLDLSPAKIAETLTLLGLEVDGIENEHPSFAGVVVGEVVSVTPHPNASKLLVAQVSDGSQTYQVVCGAANCRAGVKTLLARCGALLKEPDGTQKRIEKATLRGVESFGMLCTEKELWVSSLGDGIAELPLEIPAGTDAVSVLWDPVFEISLTPNLGHCMSALGVARELSAALQIPLLPSQHLPPHAQSRKRIDEKIRVKSPDFSLAPRYMCRLIEGVSIASSPYWLQKQLLACGLEPICNAVDIANYIMMKRGQPLHAFDADRLEGASLSVGSARSKLPFVGLDGVEREAPEGTILISDAQKPVAIAGILGGKNSGVTEDTKNILIEAAIFDPAKIRQTTKKMGLRTESSQRFEKGVDPEGTPDALNDACSLLLELCGGELAAGEVDQKKGPFSPRQILCRTDRVNRLLGTRLSQNEMGQIFHRLGFGSAELEKGKLQVTVPQRRSDIAEEIDLVEEVARIYGYNHIEKRASRAATSHIPHDPAYLFEKEIREKLSGFGLQEFLNSDLIGKKLSELALEWIRPGASLLSAVHAKTEEYSVLRPSLLPGLLQTARLNFNVKNHSFAAFEIGRVHFLQNDQLVEEPMVALLLTGKREPAHWSRKSAAFDLFDLRGYLENLFESLKIAAPSYRPSSHPTFHPGRQANLHCGELLIGSLGEIHPSLLDSSDLKQRILYAEINLHLLMSQPRTHVRMKPLPQFPSSERDLTLSLPPDALIESIYEAIRSIPSLLLEKVELIDLYIPETGDSKNATLRFTYRDPLKTISFEEVEAAHLKLVDAVSKLLAK